MSFLEIMGFIACMFFAFFIIAIIIEHVLAVNEIKEKLIKIEKRVFKK